MGNFKSKLISNIIQPHSSNIFDTILANVVSFDTYYNRADIQFQDPRGLGTLELKGVPVQIGSGGVHPASPVEGTQVWVTFANKSPLHPKIVSIADEKYQLNTREQIKHNRQGSTLPDSISEIDPNALATDISYLTPSINDWVSNDNIGYTGHMDFQHINAIDKLAEAKKNLNYYEAQEPGMTHPNNSSTIKIRDKGIIDIFAETNQGMRIDPTTNTVNLLGINIKNHSTNYSIFSKDSINIVTKKFTVNGVDFTGGGGGGGYTFENL